MSIKEKLNEGKSYFFNENVTTLKVFNTQTVLKTQQEICEEIFKKRIPFLININEHPTTAAFRLQFQITFVIRFLKLLCGTLSPFKAILDFSIFSNNFYILL